MVHFLDSPFVCFACGTGRLAPSRLRRGIMMEFQRCMTCVCNAGAASRPPSFCAICWRRVRRVCSQLSFSREVPVHAAPAPPVGVPLQGVFIKHKGEACSRGGSGREALVSEDIAVPAEHRLITFEIYCWIIFDELIKPVVEKSCGTGHGAFRP